MVEIIRTETFIRKLSKIDKSYLERIEKLIVKIIQNPSVGKPMRFDRKGTREVYWRPYRFSYIHDKNKGVILFINIYHKDDQ